MSPCRRVMIVAAVSIALANFTVACGEKSEAPAPAKPAEKAAAPSEPIEKPQTPAEEPVPAEAPPTESAKAEGDAKAGDSDYQALCATCHGATGAGDGPVAQALEPKPARHDDGSYMNPLTDDYLFKVIKFGGQSVGKSPLMAPWGGSLSDQQIYNVIAFIRTLADPPYQP